ncbi:MAG: PEP-CTERM/exosortase system-associated acyltransferase [Porticoccaceae bacterium]
MQKNDMTVTTLSLADSFRRYFQVNLALTEEQKQAAYGIRYRVYCEEFGYEPIESFPSQMESDRFDARSLHCIVRHKGTGRGAGCVRLVFPQAGRGIDDLPLGLFCADSLDYALLGQLDLPESTTCEVSRLAVDTAFRRRAGEDRTRFGDVDAIDCSYHERRTFSLISVAAFLAATALTELAGRTNVFAMMEPFLPRLLAKSGIIFRKIGKEIEYHGARAPYFTTTTSAIDGMLPDLRKLYDAIHREVSEDYQKHLSTVAAALPSIALV